ncbi:hypothetical protein E3P99_01407 [Wallemia hederae]|uniref:F-box domain-containing protein n=1 Tax=Wallemia hederae TaxID=1540922 RepID=A0A4T0FRB5_9BASI|nr:hypothetical protein E3P99_01407 [Wallemia hederae]
MSINKIPTEIWEHIVELSFDDDDWDVGRRLSQVNKLIRYNILCTPIPWRRLQFSLADLNDNSIRDRFDEWASEMNERSGHAVKYIHLELTLAVIYSSDCINFALHRFTISNTLNVIKYTCETRIQFLQLGCPQAKHVIAHIHGLEEDDEPAELFVDNAVEVVESDNVLLRYPETHMSMTDIRLRSVDINFTGRHRTSAEYQYRTTGDNFYDTINTLDDEQFELILSSPVLKTLKVIHADSVSWTANYNIPTLKSITVQNSYCDFVSQITMPNIETVDLIDVHKSENAWNTSFELGSSLKHLSIIRSNTPYTFSTFNLISLNLEGSPDELHFWTQSDTGIFKRRYCSSLKALNISFTNFSLEDVLALVLDVDLEQLVCDLPNTHDDEDRDALEDAIADEVGLYWTSIDQYYEDMRINDSIVQYFFPYPKDPFSSLPDM